MIFSIKKSISKLTLLLVLFISSFLLISCLMQPVRGPGSAVHSEKIMFTTSDNLNISGNYYPSATSEKGIVLLHMLAKHSNSYDDLAAKLQEDYNVLAIDFRGHGDSDGDYTTMAERNFRLMEEDVIGAVKFLTEEKDIKPDKISLVGASLGANVAVKYVSKKPVEKLVLLSPGNNYRGVDISTNTYSGKMLVLVSDYDAYAAISVDDLEGNWGSATVKRYNMASHGTDMLKKDEQVEKDILNFLK